MAGLAVRNVEGLKDVPGGKSANNDAYAQRRDAADDGPAEVFQMSEKRFGFESRADVIVIRQAVLRHAANVSDLTGIGKRVSRTTLANDLPSVQNPYDEGTELGRHLSNASRG